MCLLFKPAGRPDITPGQPGECRRFLLGAQVAETALHVGEVGGGHGWKRSASFQPARFATESQACCPNAADQGTLPSNICVAFDDPRRRLKSESLATSHRKSDTPHTLNEASLPRLNNKTQMKR